MNTFFNNLRLKAWARAICAFAGVIVCGCVGGQAQPSAAGIEVLQIRPNFYLLAGAGGNVTAQIGPDGVVLVNAGAQEATAEILAAIRKLTDQPILYIIDTSADADIVGGNAKLSQAGRNLTTPIGRRHVEKITLLGSEADGARIVAHENTLFRMSAPTSPVPSEAWPTDPYGGKRTALYLNNEGVEILHLPAAHTDGDSVVFFRRSDVVVAGDILDGTQFPIIDVEKGGSIQGEIDALNRLLELAIPVGPYLGAPIGASIMSPLPDGTVVVAGHGRIYDQADILHYRNMMVIITDAIQDMINQKMTLEQIKAAAPAKPFEPQYGATSGPWTTNNFVEAVYKSLTNRK